MASTAALVVTSIASGGFALLGGGLNSWTVMWRDRKKIGGDTALELADTERWIWTEGEWMELNIGLQRQEARLAFAGVPDDLIEAFHEITIACWRDLQFDIEVREPEPGPGIALELLEARRKVMRAAGGYLLRNRRRAQRETLRRDAVLSVREVVDNPNRVYLR
jgi:hypothetical protein